MAPQELLLVVFCLVDDEIQALGGPPVRPGPESRPADSEVITIELVGELWGLADDAAIYRHFRHHYLAEFPALAVVDRTRFVRQAADLCWLVRRLQRRLAEAPAGPGETWLIDSCPLPVCRFGRAGYCRRFRGQAAYGFDPLARKAFYGFRFHLRVDLRGVVLGYELAPADAHELEPARELAPTPPGVGIGDRNDRSPATRAELRAAGGDLLAPFKQRKHDPDPGRSEVLLGWRRRIETVFSQLIEWFDLRRVKVRDLWHLEHRVVRKLLALTVAAWLNLAAGRSPLQLEALVAYCISPLGG
jgi:hypothetical protein